MILSLEEAASYIGLSPDELLTSFYKGTAPGKLGYKAGGRLVWNREDLLPAPVDHIVEVAPSTLCVDCGFRAKSVAGLANHRRKHG